MNQSSASAAAVAVRPRPNWAHQPHARHASLKPDMEGQAMSTAEQQEKAYKTLTAILNKALTENQILDIEFVPKQLLPPDTPLLQDGRALGLSRAFVAAAFLHAKLLFFTPSQLQNSQTPDHKANAIRAATAVLLLHDSEHLTAANARKRALVSLQRDLHLSSKSDDHVKSRQKLDEALRAEVWLLDTLHGSPLKKHSKSPTLWAQRAWLRRAFGEDVLRRALDIDSAEGLLRREVDVVVRAGGQHPQNYYSWTHARRLLPGEAWLDKHGSASIERVERVVLQPVQGFCMQHLRDSSAWSFFGYAVMHCFRQAYEIGQAQGQAEVILSLEYRVRKVLEAAVHMRYEYAPIWLFLTEVLAQDVQPTASLRLHVAHHLMSVVDRSAVERPISTTSFQSRAAKALQQLKTNSSAAAYSEVG